MRSFSLLLMISSSLFALPSGLDVKHGDAKLISENSHVSIHCSDQAILHWDDFSIAQGEYLQFIQPSRTSQVLNRVTGGAISTINGRLSANGQLLIINPHGLFLGKEAVVSADQFIGSTLDVLDQAFLSGGNCMFTSDRAGSIVHLGRIEAGDIFLLSSQIDQQGVLKGSGHVALGVGSKILLKPEGSERLFVELMASDTDGIGQGGEIDAHTIEIKAKSPFEGAVRASGQLNAFSRVEREGRIYLLAEEGTLEVDGAIKASGGHVQCLGDEVRIGSLARIDVSAQGDGGTVLIGGDYQGIDREICNSGLTLVEKGATIHADAINTGDGGKVIVWSDVYAEMAGFISVRGGENGGDGGFVEVSGAQGFTYNGLCDRRAPMGKSGKLLLDPESDVTISAAATSGGSLAGTPATFTPTLASSNVNVGALTTALGMGDVEILTGPIVPTGGLGTITVNDAISWSAATQLTFTAAQSITINANITNTNSSGNFDCILFNANQGVTPLTGNFAGISFPSAVTVSTVDGRIVMNGTGGTTGSDQHGISSDGAIIRSTNGSITLLGISQSTAAGIGNTGLFLSNGTQVRSTGSGTSPESISLTGTGGAGNNSLGIILLDSRIRTVDADVTITATATSSGTGAAGFETSGGGGIESTGSGNITLAGTGGSGSTGNHGVEFQQTTVEVTGSGSLSVTGTGGSNVSGSSNHGIMCSGVSGATTIQSTSTGSDAGSITFVGTASGEMECHGFATESGAGSVVITSVNGDVSITGTASGTLTENRGVFIDDGAAISTSGTDSDAAMITLRGTGSTNGTDECQGIAINSPDIASTFGPLTFIGTGNGSGTDNHGIFIETLGSITSSGAGAITFSGTGSASGSRDNDGVRILGITVESTSSGLISLDGTGGSGDSSQSIFLDPNTTIRTTGSGDIRLLGRQGTSTGSTSYGINSVANILSTSTASDAGQIILTGTGAAGTSDNLGINMSGTISSVNGNISLTGTAAGSTTSNIGILLLNATVSSTGTTANGATITMRGTGTGTSNSSGIFINGGSGSVSSEVGEIRLDGTSNATLGINHGIVVEDLASKISSLMTAPIVLVGQSGPGTTNNKGVFFNGGGLSTVNGDVTITGLSRGTTTLNSGIAVTSGPNGRLISTGSGAISLFGFGSEAGTGFNHGINVHSDATITATAAGAITMDGIARDGTSLSYGIRGFGSSTVISTLSGNLSLLGRANTDRVGCRLSNGAQVATTSGALSATTQSDLQILNGATIEGGSDPLTVNAANNLLIRASDTSSGVTGIIPGTGNASFTVGDNLSVIGGAAAGSLAQIGSYDSNSSADMVFTSIGGNLMVMGSSTESYALIGHGDPMTGSQVLSGEIRFDSIGGDLVVEAANDSGGSQGFAQIGHIDGPSATLSGDIEATVSGLIAVYGGTLAGSSYSRIGHGGQGNSPTQGAGSISLKAGTDMLILSAAGDAQIVNNSGSLTLVVDNLFPTSPTFGKGRFIFGSTLESSGQLRIYTVRQSLNSVSGPINGAAFMPGVEGEDNPQEAFNVYFPGGDFSTAPFRFYYKLPIESAEAIQNALFELAVANSELTNRLPIFRYMRLPNYPWHHPSFCVYDDRMMRCNPDFDPYGSFIFEDNVYWIGIIR